MNASGLKSQLECPICFSISKLRIFLCVNGHKICEKCFNSLNTITEGGRISKKKNLAKICPQSRCKYDDPPRRNRDLESIIESCDLALSCSYEGCNVELVRSELLEHEEKCPKKPNPDSKIDITCPVTDCGQVTSSRHSLESHLQQSHEDDLVEVIRKHILEIPVSATKSSKRNFHGRLLVFKDEESGFNFYPQLLKKDKVWHFWIKADTDSTRSAAKLKCDIKLKNDETGEQLQVNHKRLYCLVDSVDDIISDDEHISMSSDQFNKLLNIASDGKVANVKCSFKIRQC